MMSLLLLSAALFPAAEPAPAKLRVEEVQACYAYCGPERVGSDYYPPYDSVGFRYWVSGVRTKADGSVDVSIALELKDAAGKTVLRDSDWLTQRPTLGGDTFLASSGVMLTGSPPPGEYTAVVTVKDNLSSETAGFERKVHIKPIELAVNGFLLFRDAEQKVSTAGTFTAGEFMYFAAQVIGLSPRDGKVALTGRLQMLDGGTGEVVADLGDRSQQADVAVPPTLPVRYGGFLMNLNRSGWFLLRLTVTDDVAKKTVTFEAPLRVAKP
jgi:hypothetical protein